MEGSVIHSGMQGVSTVPSSSMQNDVIARQSRSKVTVAFTEANERVRTSIDSTSDSQTPTRKSGMIPLLRRGSRKQTLSLNPEEREALENLIEEVIMDGMGDGVVDSDGSSSDGDDRVDEMFDKDSPTAGDGSTGNSSSKASTAPSVAVGGKKYYPGQLKVALKHMTNLPPRFVRKLAKAQQYLDASGADDLARPTATIVGSIEEEEEGVTAPLGKDDALPASNPAYSPGSGSSQLDRDKDKTKIKETKLQEAKKQIRTLLCDKDQYVDEKSATVGNLVAANAEVETTVIDTGASVGCVSSRIAAEKKIDNFIKSVETPVKQLQGQQGVSKFATSRVAATAHAPDAVISAVCHVSQAHSFSASPISYMQANATGPALSANVPDFVPKCSTSVPVGYNVAAGHGTSFVRFTRDTAPISPVQLDAFSRTVPTSVSALDPRYYVQPTVVQGQPASYYGLPQLYNTPPPSTGMPSRIMGEMLPSASCLVQSASVNGAGSSQSGSYSIPGQYSVPAYSSVYTPPYLESAPQSMQTGMYPSYGASSQSKPIAYQMTGGSTYCAGSSGNIAGVGAEYQYGIVQPNSVSSYPCNTVSFVSFNGAVQGHNSHNRMSTPRATGTVDFSRKSQGGHSRNSSGVTSAAPFARSSTHRFSYAGDTTSNRMTATKNVSNVLSPVVRFGSPSSENSRFAVASTCIPAAVSSTLISSYDNGVINRQTTSIKHQVVDFFDVPSSVAVVTSQLASTPTSCLQSSDNLQANFVKTNQHSAERSRRSLEIALLSDMNSTCVNSDASNNSSRHPDVNTGGQTNRLQFQQFPALINSAQSRTSDKPDSQERLVQTPMADAGMDNTASGTTQKDKSDEDLVDLPLCSAGEQVSVISESGLIVEEINVVHNNKTDLSGISDSLELSKPSHCSQESLLELGDQVIALQSEMVVEKLQEDRTAIVEAVPCACEGIDVKTDNQFEVDGIVDSVAVGLVKSIATLHVMSEACGRGTTGVAISDDNNCHCNAIQADITLSDDVSYFDVNSESVAKSALVMHECLSVKLSCDFVKRLTHMFGNEGGQTQFAGLNSSTSMQTFLSSDVLRQIYDSLVDVQLGSS